MPPPMIAMAARQAPGEVDPTGTTRLRSAVDALLLEMAHHIAGTMVPILPNRTEH